MLVNVFRTKAQVISRQDRLCPFSLLVVGWYFGEGLTEFKGLGVVLDTKLSFQSHISFIAAFAASKLGIIRKSLCLVGDPVLVLRSSLSFLLPILEYGSFSLSLS